MRLNIEWIAPWIIGKPYRYWLIHWWYNKKGLIRNKSSFGFTLIGFYVSVSKDALWSGFSISINLWGSSKPRLYVEPVIKAKCIGCGKEKGIVYEGKCDSCASV